MSKRAWVVLCAIGGLVLGVAGVFAWQKFSSDVTVSFHKPAVAAPPADVGEAPVAAFAAVPEKPPHPRYSNALLINEGIVLQPGDLRIYRLTGSIKPDTRFRLKWRSQFPVEIAIMSGLPAPRVRLFIRHATNCGQHQVNWVDTDCVMPGIPGVDLFLMVMDERGAGTAAVGVGAAMLGSKQLLNDAIAPNRSAIVVSQKRCIENCGVSDTRYP